MIIIGSEELIGITVWNTVNQYVVSCLNIERFLDLGVRRNEQVDQNKRGDEQVERPRKNSHGIQCLHRVFWSLRILELRAEMEQRVGNKSKWSPNMYDHQSRVIVHDRDFRSLELTQHVHQHANTVPARCALRVRPDFLPGLSFTMDVDAPRARAAHEE